MLNLELTEHSNNVEILKANVDLVKNSGTRSYKLLHFFVDKVCLCLCKYCDETD